MASAVCGRPALTGAQTDTGVIFQNIAGPGITAARPVTETDAAVIFSGN